MKTDTFTTPEDLYQLIEAVKNYDPSNEDGTIREYLCVHLLLISAYNHSRISLPFEVTKNESPDFIVIENGKKIGIEHTRATLESFKIAESELKKHQKHPEGSFIELSYYSPSNEPKQADIGIVHPDDELHGAGYSGNIIELDWAEIIINAIVKKTILLNEVHFQKHPGNNLIIDDDSPVYWFKDETESLSILKKQYDEALINTEFKFNQIHIFSNQIFIYDVFGECIRTDVSKKNLHIVEGLS